MLPGLESVMEPLRSWALHPQDAAPREQLPQQPPGIHVAVDVDLPSVQSGVPGVNGGAQQFFVPEGVAPPVHGPLHRGIEQLG